MPVRARLTADDFGLSEAVNEGIEQAHRDGVLDAASLMVAGPAAADAVMRARRNPGLKVGLHLVVIEGPAALGKAQIPDLIDEKGWLPSDQLSLGLRYFFLPHVRRQLRAEIAAQFAGFAATGLNLAHADAHKHMHLHPTVAAMLIAEGRKHGLTRVRVPNEPPSIMRRCGVPATLGAHAMHAWSRVLRGQIARAGMMSNDHIFGLAWTGHMTEEKLLRLIPHLPAGEAELYFHPAAGRDSLLDRLMPSYDHDGELTALLSPAVRAALGR